jgi:hypothetical protein
MQTIKLLEALMRQSRDNANSLSKALRGRVSQPQIYRFLNGETKEPRRHSLEPIADYYSIPVQAFYDAELATRIMANLSQAKSPMIGINGQADTGVLAAPFIAPRPAPMEPVEVARKGDPLANRKRYMTLDLAESLDRFKDLKNLKIAYALAADALDKHYESLKYPVEPDLFAADPMPAAPIEQSLANLSQDSVAQAAELPVTRQAETHRL